MRCARKGCVRGAPRLAVGGALHRVAGDETWSIASGERLAQRDVMTLPILHKPTIVVPVDFDEPSKRAVSLAVDFARWLEGRVVLVHVAPPTSLPEGTRLLPTDASNPVDLGEYVSQHARHMLEAHFLSLLISGVEVRKEVRTGHVVETILRAIDECHAGLVVVGTHGRAGAARLMLGSVAEGLVRRSLVPVLVARKAENGAPHHDADASFTSAAIASGAVAGAATGALGGPVGAVVGERSGRSWAGSWAASRCEKMPARKRTIASSTTRSA